MAKKTSKKQKVSKGHQVNSVVAKSDDGTVQITFTIPFEIVEKERLKSAAHLAENVEVPGFRKGKAPLEKALDKIPQNELLEHTLSHILPSALSEVVKRENLTLAIYPKFELVSIKENEDWQVRAITCQIPDIKLGDYKKLILGETKAKSIWTPGKSERDEDKQKELSRVEKEQEVIKILIDKIDVKIPSILVKDDVDSRLAQLLQRLEKLGLTLESYLKTANKTSESLRAEYNEQSRASLKVDFILTKIAEIEKVVVNPKDVEAALKAASADPSIGSSNQNPHRKRLIEAILAKKEVLNTLVNLL